MERGEIFYRIRGAVSKHILKREVDAVLGESERKKLKSVLSQVPDADKITREDAENWAHRTAEHHFGPAPGINEIIMRVGQYYDPYPKQYSQYLPDRRVVLHYYTLPALYLALKEGEISKDDLRMQAGVEIYKQGEPYPLGSATIQWDELKGYYNVLKNAGVERLGPLHYNVIERAGKLYCKLAHTVDGYATGILAGTIGGTGWFVLHAAFGHETKYPVFLALSLAHYAGLALSEYKLRKYSDKYAKLANPETFIRTAAREIASEMGKTVGRNVKEEKLKHHIAHAAKLLDHPDPIMRTFARHALKEMIKRVKK